MRIIRLLVLIIAASSPVHSQKHTNSDLISNVLSGNLKSVKKNVKQGSDPQISIRGFEGMNAIFFAAAGNEEKILSFLLKSIPELENEKIEMAISASIIFGAAESVKIFVQNGINISEHIESAINGRSGMCFDIFKEHLLKNGLTNISVFEGLLKLNGCTEAKSHNEIVEMILEQGQIDFDSILKKNQYNTSNKDRQFILSAALSGRLDTSQNETFLKVLDLFYSDSFYFQNFLKAVDIPFNGEIDKRINQEYSIMIYETVLLGLARQVNGLETFKSIEHKFHQKYINDNQCNFYSLRKFIESTYKGKSNDLLNYLYQKDFLKQFETCGKCLSVGSSDGDSSNETENIINTLSNYLKTQQLSKECWMQLLNTAISNKQLNLIRFLTSLEHSLEYQNFKLALETDSTSILKELIKSNNGIIPKLRQLTPYINTPEEIYFINQLILNRQLLRSRPNINRIEERNLEIASEIHEKILQDKHLYEELKLLDVNHRDTKLITGIRHYQANGEYQIFTKLTQKDAKPQPLSNYKIGSGFISFFAPFTAREIRSENRNRYGPFIWFIPGDYFLHTLKNFILKIPSIEFSDYFSSEIQLELKVVDNLLGKEKIVELILEHAGDKKKFKTGAPLTIDLSQSEAIVSFGNISSKEILITAKVIYNNHQEHQILKIENEYLDDYLVRNQYFYQIYDDLNEISDEKSSSTNALVRVNLNSATLIKSEPFHKSIERDFKQTLQLIYQLDSINLEYLKLRQEGSGTNTTNYKTVYDLINQVEMYRDVNIAENSDLSQFISLRLQSDLRNQLMKIITIQSEINQFNVAGLEDDFLLETQSIDRLRELIRESKIN